MKTGAEGAAQIGKGALDLDEVKASGETPRNELYAPAVDGRDFVSERLVIERKVLELDPGITPGAARTTQAEEFDLGLAPVMGWTNPLASTAVRRQGSGDVEKRLDLRKQFIAGAMTAEEVDPGSDDRRRE